MSKMKPPYGILTEICIYVKKEVVMFAFMKKKNILASNQHKKEATWYLVNPFSQNIWDKNNTKSSFDFGI